MTSLLDPAVVPNLKHFSVVDTLAESVDGLERSRLADLLPQLQTLNLGFFTWTSPKFTFLQSAAERTLVDCVAYHFTIPEFETAKVVNLRLIGITSVTEDRIDYIVETLNRLITSVQSTPELCLRRLYLDSSLLPRSSFPQPVIETMDKLTDACRERSIEIVFDRIAVDFRFDPSISAEFVERQKKSQAFVLPTSVNHNHEGGSK
ncbi:hypothetical protein JCM5350_000256 [Sporobolomyces pararoseus]